MGLFIYITLDSLGGFHVSTSAVHWMFEYVSEKKTCQYLLFVCGDFLLCTMVKITIKPPFGMIFYLFPSIYLPVFLLGPVVLRGFVLGQGRDLRRLGPGNLEF